MTKPSLFRAWTVFFALSPVLLTAAVAAPSGVPVSAAALLPDPPRQNDPWTPPATTLPPELVAATKTLFRQGLADPRGGEYREVTVHVDNFFPGRMTLTQVHGWIMPRGPGEMSAFAVCWDGQVYPVTSIGGSADLKADVAAMARNGLVPANNVAPESQAISASAFSPLRACLLLRLGEGPLAAQVWAAQPSYLRDGDPYLRLAADWTWGQLRRVLDVREQGDDPLALFLARRLTRIRARIEGEAAERRLPRPNPQGYGSPTSSHSYLDFLDPLPDILADQEERARALKHPSALLAGEKAFPSKADYIAALIGDLNQVYAGGWENSVPTMGDEPIVRALGDQGDAAVEPLIQAIATDTRLVRNVKVDIFQRRVYPTRVARAAFGGVVIILQTSEFGDGSYRDDDPARTAAAVQRYWDKYKNLSPAERWYRTLADDQATPAQWQEAADAIVRPVNVTYLGSGATSGLIQPGMFPRRGESLRGKSGPSVSELMARRIPQVAAVDRKHPWTGVWNAHQATLMALDAARWDALASVPALRAQAVHLSGLPTTGYYADPQIAADQAALTLARVRRGDTQALSGYVAWLLTGPLPEGTLVQAFEPLWRFPRDPAVTAAAARLFGGSAPPWLPALRDGNSPALGNLLKSPLLGLSVFRGSFLNALRDKTALGNVTANGNGWWGANLPGLNASPPDTTIIDLLRPKTPWTMTIRRCDMYAWHLSRLGGMPRFEFYWPQSKRDAAIAQASDRLRRYGPHFAYEPSLEAFWNPDAQGSHAAGLGYLWDTFNEPLAHLAFPRLDHPATAAEVARGAAIFSLTGLGARRVWPLPQWPLPAQWVTDRRYPQSGPYDASGKPTVVYQQDGLVWQAEEVQQGGKWQRFYGFVGPHDIVRVPAEEIEFPQGRDSEWGRLFGPFDGKAALGGGSETRRVGDPVPITLEVRNRSGQDQNMPPDWLRVEADGHPALRVGLTLTLLWQPVRLPGTAGTDQPLTKLVPVRTAAFTPSPATRRLNATEKTTVLHLDLRDWYDLRRPGDYYLWFNSDDTRSGSATGHSSSAAFALTPR